MITEDRAIVDETCKWIKITETETDGGKETIYVKCTHPNKYKNCPCFFYERYRPIKETAVFASALFIFGLILHFLSGGTLNSKMIFLLLVVVGFVSSLSYIDNTGKTKLKRELEECKRKHLIPEVKFEEK